jgi:hypothetical protein
MDLPVSHSCRKIKTYGSKITNVPVFFFIALGLNDLDGGNSITWAIGRGGPSKQGH